MKVTWSPPNRSIGFLDALGLAGFCGLLVARFIPVARLPFWGCPIRQTTGWPCPGCGLTRVADRLSHGNVLGAWQANPLGTVAAVGFALAAVWMICHLVLGLRSPEVELTPREWTRLRMVLTIAVVVNYAFVVVKTRFPAWL